MKHRCKSVGHVSDSKMYHTLFIRGPLIFFYSDITWTLLLLKYDLTLEEYKTFRKKKSILF